MQDRSVNSPILTPPDILPGILGDGPGWALTHTDPARELTDIACAVGNRMRCDVCSIYRLDPHRQVLVLAATVGLRQNCVERLQMAVQEGLCGLVVQQQSPVSVAEHAAEHPRFKYFPEAGEDPYETFLGVPIASDKGIVGVLVVQTIECRTFSSKDHSALEQIGAQIAPLVARLNDDRSGRDQEKS